jgi:hypothetical protein
MELYERVFFFFWWVVRRRWEIDACRLIGRVGDGGVEKTCRRQEYMVRDVLKKKGARQINKHHTRIHKSLRAAWSRCQTPCRKSQ